MQEMMERYLGNVARCALLNHPSFEPSLADDELLARIQENAREVHSLILENNEILDGHVLNKRPEEVTDEDVRDLNAFADRLFLYNRSVDDGTAYRIHRLLLDVATLRGDRDMRIRELYYVGITLQYMKISCNDLELFVLFDRVRAYFDEGARYMDQYEEIESETTRSYIIRCLANRKLGVERKENFWPEYCRLFDETMAVITSPKYRAMNPNIPWADYEYSMHADRCGAVTSLRLQHGDDSWTKPVLESARYVHDHTERQERNNDRFTYSRISYLYAAARYHAGEITLVELLEELFEFYDHADWSDYSDQGLVYNVNVACQIQYYIHSLPEEERPPWRIRRRKVFAHVSHYLSHLKPSVYMYLLNNNVQEIVSIRALGDMNFREHKLEYILSCHKPTYVHSCMVAWLTARITTRMIQIAPERMVGVLGTADEREVFDRAQEIVAHAHECALYHDMGKNLLLNAVSLYYRKLIDVEFSNIQHHPIFGARLLRMCNASEDAVQVALHHHRFANGKGGYPNPCEPCTESALPLVRIVSVADSLDAGTDNVGRCYAAVKTFDGLLEELRAGSGTRYAKEVVDLFDDEAFAAEIREGLHIKRREVYCRAYREEEGEFAGETLI